MRILLFLLAVGAVVVILQATSFAFMIRWDYKPDLFLVLVIWSSLRMSFSSGVGFTFLLGMLADILSGSPTGLFALTYILTYIASGYLNATLHVDTHVGRALLAFLGVLATGNVVLMVRWMDGPVGFGWHAAQGVVVKALLTGLVGLGAFPLMDGAWRRYARLAGQE